ncbi:hypothetical protein LSTR_LSTR011798 [Laodelphax striatellus]|uniref:Rho-GAP domain-containing protein n=1 Tax=Laodelphax striatellus TaxID=195883 RepID=A0A482XPI7_LAOST|nr:hypothetical protein LSTR_LSTR011798 [Laodelphax striatellus]
MSDNSIQKRCSFRTRAKARYRRTSRDLTVGGESTTEMGKPKTDGVTKERKGKRERWLLTRKTWRYMADAGRKLIPEGALNRPDDVPKIEAYFQEVCHREPRFLLWRKQSYPGALGFRARGRSRGGRRKIGGSCRDKTSSADEADDLRQQQERESQSSSQDSPYKKIIRPSLLQLKQEFLFGRKESPPETTPTKDALVENVLCHFDDGTSSKALDHQELLDRLTAHLASIELKESQQSRSDSYSVDTTQKQLIETMRRYYSKSTNRDKVISDILTDRKLLHKMYFELRRARGFSMGSQSGSTSRGGGSTFDGSDGGGILKTRSRTGMGTDSSGAGPSGWSSSGAFRRVFNPSMSNFPGSTWKYSDFDEGDEENDEASPWSSPPQSDTPLSGDLDYGTQTDPITEQMMSSIDEEMRRQEEVQKAAIAAQQKEVQKAGGSGGRRSSLNHDDVSQSVSDTIKRYLKMARKKSTDSDKADRFKRINYDQTLRDIKAKPEDPISKDEDQDKGIQTDLSWVSAIKTLKLAYVPVEDTPPEVSSPPPATKSLLSSGQMFLSNLLHGLQHSSSSCSVVAAAAGSMQKSKSSSSVVQQGTRLVARKVWKGRSKSQTRATPAATSTWTPQGNCVWTNVTGRSVTVEDTPLLQLTDVERRLLQKVALAKLQALNLGVAIRTPSEAVSSTVQKPKRRAHLLKRKAITTGFFDTNRKDQEKKGDGSGGLVFGIPLGQCVENERAVRLRSGSHEEPVTQLRRESHHGSRTSFTSLIETPRCADERGSCESLISPTLSMPGLLDSLSTPDLSASSGVDGTVGPGVPNIVATCLSHLETHGLHTLGLFRVSSSKKRVRQNRRWTRSLVGKESTLDAESCPHDVATLLKEYFRDLPDSLLCKDLYPAFIQTQRIRNRRLQQEALRNLIYLLPAANRDTLWALLNLLSLVASNAEDHQSSDGEWRLGNKMDSNNLATLFAPNILHSSSSNKSLKDEMSAERVEERADAINVVRCLIDNCKQLYVVSAEMMDEVYNHLMDSAPEVLDTLLRRRDLQADETVDEQEVSMMSEDLSERLATTQDEQQASCAEEVRGGGGKERRMWSRGAFTHETAGMGGPDAEVKPRYKGRSSRERISKKRREDGGGGRRSDYDTGSNTPSRRSSAQGVDEYSSEQINSSRSSLESGAITAVLKIPVPASASASFAVNLDDSDIPYIEDSSAAAAGDRQHMSLSMVRTSGASSSPGQQRTRSQSGGSDSSTTTTTYHVHHHYHHQTAPHSDSAIGTHSSSAAPSSHSGVYSSPPSSWASSTPPTSPTSPTTPYQYDDEPTTARISIPTKKDTSRTTPDTRQVILQRVTVKSTGELQHVKSSYIQPSSTQLYLQTTPQVYVQPSTPSPQIHPTTPQLYNPQSSPQPAPRRRSGGTFQRLLSSGSTGSVSKSVSSSAIGGSGGVERIIPILKEGSQSPSTVVPDRKITTSISSIGGAVMRSKTADIERMIKVSSSAQSKQQPAVVVKKSVVGVSDKEDDKRKRRYTDVRHQTRHIPTDLAAEGGSSGGGAVGEQRRTVVWKRGQIISSEPKERRGFL